MPSSPVVGALDPGHDRQPELLTGGPPMLVENVLLQEREERFHRRVIAHGADPTHRSGQAGSTERMHEFPGSKLTKEFYERAFGLPIYYQDDSSAIYNFGNTLINLLSVDEAPGLIAPAAVAGRDAGARVQFTITVDDVDETCASLQSQGIHLLNGPTDRPWGIRTASFQDPGGHIWEIAH